MTMFTDGPFVIPWYLDLKMNWLKCDCQRSKSRHLTSVPLLSTHLDGFLLHLEQMSLNRHACEYNNSGL